MKEFKIDNSPKIESGFKAPDAYFETFAQNLMEKLPQEETKVISIFQKRKVIMMVAAAVLAIALIIPIVNTPTAPLSQNIDGATLENYLSYQTNINQYDLLNALDEDDINSIKTNIALDETNLGSSTIEDVLITNGNLEQLLLE
tara:strand:+ start:172 stop:603 length:432 start_codon:yes stop_codon:yes gene_type:complete